MASGDLLEVCTGINCIQFSDYTGIYENGYSYLNCFSDGSAGFYTEQTYSYCDLGYQFDSIFFSDYAGCFYSCYLSDGSGSYIEFKNYESGTFLYCCDYCVPVGTECYLDGFINYYADGNAGSYCEPCFCDLNYLFETGFNTSCVSDGVGGVIELINCIPRNVNYLTINWDFDASTKAKYFNPAQSANGDDIFLTFKSQNPFYEINAYCDTNIYLDEVFNCCVLCYNEVCVPFIFIKNNGQNNLILHTDVCTGDYYDFSYFKYHGYNLYNFCTSCTENQFLIDTVGCDYKDFLIKPNESILICYNSYHNETGAFCVLAEYPFGFFYKFKNINEINPSGLFPMYEVSGSPTYLYENMEDYFYIDCCEKVLKSMYFESLVDDGVCLEIGFNKEICYLSGALYNAAGNDYYSGSQEWNDNVYQLSGFVPDLSLCEYGFCQINGEYIPYYGGSYFHFFLYECCNSICDANHRKVATFNKCVCLCSYKQIYDWNLLYKANQPFTSNLKINFANICDGLNNYIVRDFKNEKYDLLIDENKSICILLNFDFNKSKLARYKYMHCYQYDSIPGSVFCCQNSFNGSFAYDNSRSFFDSCINFYANFNNNCLDLNCYFYLNCNLTISNAFSDAFNSKFPIFNLPASGGCTDPCCYDYIPVALFFDTYLCYDYDVFANLQILNDNYSLTDVKSKNFNRCNMYLPTNFCNNYCLNLCSVNSMDDNYYQNLSFTKTINCKTDEYQNNKSLIYNINVVNNEAELNTCSLRQISNTDASEKFFVNYDTFECCFCYKNFEFTYTPINSVIFQDKYYQITKNTVPILFCGSVCSETVLFPNDAFSDLKFKVLTNSKIKNKITNASVYLHYSDINFTCNFCNLNNLSFKLPKITCTGLNGFDSPSISIELENSIDKNNYLDFYINPAACFAEDKNYDLIDFLHVLNSKLNSGILSCSLCTGIGYKISDFSKVLNQKPAFHVIYNCDICCAYSDFKQGTCQQMYCYTEQIDFKKIYFSGHKLGWPLSLGSSLFCCINTGTCPVTCYITGYKCTMVNTYYGVGMPYYPTGYYSGVCCEALYSYQTGYSSYTISKLANKGCLFNEKIQGPELWGDGFYIPTSTGQISTACGCLLFEGYCFDALNFLCINSPNQYSAINCKILSTNYIDFLNSVISFFNFHSYCSYLNCGVITYDTDLNARSYCYACSGYTAANSALSSCLTGNYLKNPIVCFAEGSSGSYACCATVLTPFTYIVVSGNTGQYTQGSTEYNSLMLDLQNENINGFICSNWNLIDEKIFSDNSYLNYPISYKSQSGNGYNYILPILCEISICNDATHCASGQIHEQIQILDKLNFKSSGNLFSGNEGSTYSFYFQNTNFALSSSDVNNTSSRCLNLTRCYSFTGIQPVNIISNYPLSCIRHPIVRPNLDAYVPDPAATGLSGTFFYEYDINNYSSSSLRFISPDFTLICEINWNINCELYQINSKENLSNLGFIKGNASQINFDANSIIANNNYNYGSNTLSEICFKIIATL